MTKEIVTSGLFYYCCFDGCKYQTEFKDKLRLHFTRKHKITSNTIINNFMESIKPHYCLIIKTKGVFKERK